MENKLIIYPEFDGRIRRDCLYSVSVTQASRTERLPVYNHTEPSRVNRNPVDGRRADINRRFCSFAFAGEGVRVDIRVGCDFHDYTVIPADKRFRHAFRDGVISVFLDHPDYFAVRLDGGDHTLLAVLADEPETEIPTAGERTLVCDRWQEVPGGILTLDQPGTTLYIPAGAVLNARVRILADDCRVLGRGAIVDPVGDIYRYNAEKLDTGVVLVVLGASRVCIDGIHLLNAKAFNVEVIGVWEKKWAEDNRVRNVKILSTQMSTDGITFCYYQRNSLAEHCFVYCGDNALVYEEGAHYRDITIGTTCNALYPQTDVIDSSVEDVHVFRADEGIINCEYGGEGGRTRIARHRIRNLCAVDVTFTPYVFFVEVPGIAPVESTDGGLTVENVWLPALSDTRTTTFLQNFSKGNYAIALRNLSIGGRVVEEVTPETVGGLVNTAGQTFICTADTGFDPALPRSGQTVNWQNRLNVFAGARQIFFQHPILSEDGELLLPAEQLREALCTDRTGKTVLRGGAAYLPLASLVGSGMAESVKKTGNRVVITPHVPAGNLLLPDRGILSHFTEHICYDSHLLTFSEDREMVYRILNTNAHRGVGIFRLIEEELETFGAGRYRLSFSARAQGADAVWAIIDYSTRACAKERFALSPEWRKCALSFAVEEADLVEPKKAIIIGGGDEIAIPVLDLKQICLIKEK